MEDEVLQKKREKAARYASEPERFEPIGLVFKVRSDSATRFLIYNQSTGWHCDCLFFLENGICSHSMAGEQLLKGCVFPQSSVFPYEIA